MKNDRTLRFSLFLAGLVIVLFAAQARAQYEDGSLLGTIRDTTGAVVGNAAITITNDATGIVTAVHTDAAGNYLVQSLRVGVYTIHAQAAGFAPAEANPLHS